MARMWPGQRGARAERALDAARLVLGRASPAAPPPPPPPKWPAEEDQQQDRPDAPGEHAEGRRRSRADTITPIASTVRNTAVRSDSYHSATATVTVAARCSGGNIRVDFLPASASHATRPTERNAAYSWADENEPNARITFEPRLSAVVPLRRDPVAVPRRQARELLDQPVDRGEEAQDRDRPDQLQREHLVDERAADPEREHRHEDEQEAAEAGQQALLGVERLDQGEAGRTAADDPREPGAVLERPRPMAIRNSKTMMIGPMMQHRVAREGDVAPTGREPADEPEHDHPDGQDGEHRPR